MQLFVMLRAKLAVEDGDEREGQAWRAQLAQMQGMATIPIQQILAVVRRTLGDQPADETARRSPQASVPPIFSLYSPLLDQLLA